MFDDRARAVMGHAARRFRRFTGDGARLVPSLRDPMINVVSLDTARSSSSNISISVSNASASIRAASLRDLPCVQTSAISDS
ncbi:MAG TPA: hypothetical protein VK607_03395, partial [Kofleriaceae bacterium]|nr:hypothetical protein [Kofleriaceae bacterium]